MIQLTSLIVAVIELTSIKWLHDIDHWLMSVLKEVTCIGRSVVQMIF